MTSEQQALITKAQRSVLQQIALGSAKSRSR